MINEWINDVKYVCVVTDKNNNLIQVIHINENEIHIPNNIGYFGEYYNTGDKTYKKTWVDLKKVQCYYINHRNLKGLEYLINKIYMFDKNTWITDMRKRKLNTIK